MHRVTGKQLAVRPVLDTERPDTHGWSLGASDGDHNIRLDAMDEGLTRLVASLPTDEAESKGEACLAFLLNGSRPGQAVESCCLLGLPAHMLMSLKAAVLDHVCPQTCH